MKISEEMKNQIKKLIEDIPWLGFESVNDFILESVRRYIIDLKLVKS